MTRVLAVEDSADLLYILKLELEWLGYTVDAARDGVRALELARRNPPDIILSDVRMPGIDGIELIKRMRRIPELRAVPAIALSGSATGLHVQQALAAGFTLHLTKPVEMPELAVAIEKLMEKSFRKAS